MHILVAMRHYPISLGRYMKFALQELGHTLWTIGTFDASIPWNRNKDYSQYIDIPDFEVPDTNLFLTEEALGLCPVKPDLILNIDSVFGLVGHNSQNIPQVLIQVDPHCLKEHYRNHIADFDHAFCMQKNYMVDYADLMAPGRFHWMPFAFDPKYHKPSITPFAERPYHIGLLSGLLYDNRLRCLAAMEAVGLNINQESGILFDDVSPWYAECQMAFNASSLQDLPCRVWEGWATANLVLTNRVPDLESLPDFQEDREYIAYSSLAECVDKALYYSHHLDEAEEIALCGLEVVHRGKHTWQHRMQDLLATSGVP